MHQKGYVIYCPGSRSIVISNNVIFDELFTSAIALTWQKFQDGLTLRPLASFITDVGTTLEHTGTISTIRTPVEEGNTPTPPPPNEHESHADPDDDVPDLVTQGQDDENSTAESEDDEDDASQDDFSEASEDDLHDDTDFAPFLDVAAPEPEPETPHCTFGMRGPSGQTSLPSFVALVTYSER